MCVRDSPNSVDRSSVGSVPPSSDAGRSGQEPRSAKGAGKAASTAGSSVGRQEKKQAKKDDITFFLNRLARLDFGDRGYPEFDEDHLVYHHLLDRIWTLKEVGQVYVKLNQRFENRMLTRVPENEVGLLLLTMLWLGVVRKFMDKHQRGAPYVRPGLLVPRANETDHDSAIRIAQSTTGEMIFSEEHNVTGFYNDSDRQMHLIRETKWSRLIKWYTDSKPDFFTDAPAHPQPSQTAQPSAIGARRDSRPEEIRVASDGASSSSAAAGSWFGLGRPSSTGGPLSARTVTPGASGLSLSCPSYTSDAAAE